MCKVVMIENNVIVELETLEEMAREVIKGSDCYLVVNEEGTILDCKKLDKLIKI